MKLFNKSSKKMSLVFYLEKKKGFLFINEEHPIKIDFPQEAFNNAEVTDKQKCIETIENVLMKHEITDANVLVLLGKGVTFEKDMSKISLVDQFAFVQQYIDSVLFEDVIHKVFRIKGETLIVATNKSICDMVLPAFESRECTVFGIIPEAIFEKVLPNLHVDTLTSNLVFSRLELLKNYTLLTTFTPVETGIKYSNSLEINSRVGILLGIFVLLLAILGTLVYTDFIQPQTNHSTPKEESRIKIIKTIPTPSQESITATPTATPSTELTR